MHCIDRQKFKKQCQQDGVTFLSVIEAQVRVDNKQAITLVMFDGEFGELYAFFASNNIYGTATFGPTMPFKLVRSTWNLPYRYSDDDSTIVITTAQGVLDQLVSSGSTIKYIATEAELFDILDMKLRDNMIQHDLSEMSNKRPTLAQHVDPNIDLVTEILKDLDPAAAKLCADMWEQDRMLHRARISAVNELVRHNEAFWDEFKPLLGIVIRDKDGSWQVTRRESSQFLNERGNDVVALQFSKRYFKGTDMSMTTIHLDLDSRVDGPGYRLTLPIGGNEVREMVTGCMFRMTVAISDPIFHRHDVETEIIIALSRENTEYLITHFYRLFAKHYGPSTPV